MSNDLATHYLALARIHVSERLCRLYLHNLSRLHQHSLKRGRPRSLEQTLAFLGLIRDLGHADSALRALAILERINEEMDANHFPYMSDLQRIIDCYSEAVEACRRPA